MKKSESSLVPIIILGQVYKQGGVATCIEEIIRVFTEKDRVISLVTFTNPADFSDELKNTIEQNESISAIHLPSDSIAFLKLLKNSKNSIVISNLYYSALLLLFPGSRKFHILHGWGMLINGLPRFLSGNLGNMMGGWFADKTIANSYHTALVGRTFGIDIDTIIPLGIPQSRFNPQTDRSIDRPSRTIDLLYVGRFIKVKKIDVLIKSVESLSKLIPEISLHVIGGKMSDLDFELDASVDVNKLMSKNIYFHGFVDNQTLSELYRSSKIFISLHPDEPFGLTFVEALAQGTPIIASKGSGMAPFIDEKMGILIDIDEDSVCQAVANALNKEWDCEYIKQAAINTFSWERIKDYVDSQ